MAGTSPISQLKEKNFLTGPDSEIKEYNRYTAEYEKKLGKGSALKATLGYSDMPLYNNYFVLGSAATLANGGSASRMLRPSNELSGSVQASFPLADSHYLVAGVSGNKRMIDTITYSVSDWRDAGITGPVQNQTSGEDTTYALYVQDEITLSTAPDGLSRRTLRFLVHRGLYRDKRQLPAPIKTNIPRAARPTSVPRPRWSTARETPRPVRGSIGNSFHAPNLRDTFGWWTPQPDIPIRPIPT